METIGMWLTVFHRPEEEISILFRSRFVSIIAVHVQIAAGDEKFGLVRKRLHVRKALRQAYCCGTLRLEVDVCQVRDPQ